MSSHGSAPGPSLKSKANGMISGNNPPGASQIPLPNARFTSPAFYFHKDSPISPLSQKFSATTTQGTSRVGFGINDEKSSLPLSATQVKEVPNDGPGTLPDEIYDSSMTKWRAAIRRVVVSGLKNESKWLAAMQKCVRTPWLDTYFVYTSSLGTHTFFMTVLPAFFFFGYPEVGRGLIHVLAAGVYLSSLIKDLICSPRPYAPPVTRLTMGSHHLEYGFPSTHSTNSVSIALYLHTLIYNVYKSESSSLTPFQFHAAQVLLASYAFSIVFGRLYCAMHTFTDCAAGVVLGTVIWAVQWTWGQALEEWMSSAGWIVPITTTVLALFLVNQHAEPVDDCPCFEDAIAFVSVVMGSTLARWHAANWGFDDKAGFFVSRTPGWQGKDLWDWLLWSGFASLKMIVGILLIFTWRLIAKAVLHAILPPLFRTLAQLFTLPNRRFYTPATDYTSVPAEKGLHPIPSVIDLPSTIHERTITTGATLPRVYGGFGSEGLKMRRGNIQPMGVSEKFDHDPLIRRPDDEDEDAEVKHYDADVLTKVIVYCGIAIFATHVAPITFEMLGWGVLPVI